MSYVYLLLVVNLMQSILQIAKPQSSTLTSVDRFSINHHETIRLLTLLNCGQILHTSLKQRLLGYILSHWFLLYSPCDYSLLFLYVRRSKLNSCGEVMASLHKAPYRYTQSQHPFHQLGRTAARRGGSRWGIGFLFPLRWYLQENSNFYLITKADVDSFS